jgi:hypothetical protein
MQNKLSKGMRDEMYPINFQRRLFIKTKRIIFELVNGNEDLEVPLEMNYLENIYGKDWARTDFDLGDIGNHP